MKYPLTDRIALLKTEKREDIAEKKPLLSFSFWGVPIFFLSETETLIDKTIGIKEI
jgi:hypothetical protein